MKVVVSFTGGKDSVLALSLIQLLSKQDERIDLLPEPVKSSLLASGKNLDVHSLVTFAPAGSGVTSFKAHPYSIITKQAEALSLPHSVVEIAGPDYQGAYQAAMRKLCVHEGEEVWGLVTGDILDVCSGFMEKAAAGAGVPLVRPLWGISGPDLLQSLWTLGITPMISCINKTKFLAPNASDSNAVCQFQATTAGDDTAPGSIGSSNSSSSETLDVHAYGNGGSGSGSGSTAAAATPGHCAPTSEQAALAAGSGGHGSLSASLGQGPGPGLQDAAAQVLQDPVGVLLQAPLTPELHATHLQPASAAAGVHQCGEWGEFHTMCLDGPTFARRLEIEAAVEQDADFAWCIPTSVSLSWKASASAC